MVCHLQPHTDCRVWAYNLCMSGVDLLDQRHLAHGPAWLTHADSVAPQAFNVCGPFNLDNKETLFCLPCDKESILSVEDAFAPHEYECMCVMEQMIDTSVTATNNGATVSWQLFVELEDPYPVATFPTATNAERRFVTYQAVAEMLGATGTRMVLPVCATEEALNQFPRP